MEVRYVVYFGVKTANDALIQKSRTVRAKASCPPMPCIFHSNIKDICADNDEKYYIDEDGGSQNNFSLTGCSGLNGPHRRLCLNAGSQLAELLGKD